MMKAKWLGAALAATVLSAACGEGRAIFNVDVYSFIVGTGADTVPYLIPPGGGSASNVPQKFSLVPGFSGSVVDSVRVAGTVNLVNASGAGRIGFQLYLAVDSAGTYTPSALALNLASDTVFGTNTTPTTVGGDLTSVFTTLFSQPELWVRIVAQGSNAGVVPAQGNMVLTSLRMRIVLQDDVF